MAVDLREAGSRIALGRSFDHRDQLIWSIALLSGELDEFVHLRPRPRRAAEFPATVMHDSTELEQSLFAQQAKARRTVFVLTRELSRDPCQRMRSPDGLTSAIARRSPQDLLEERQRVRRSILTSSSCY